MYEALGVWQQDAAKQWTRPTQDEQAASLLKRNGPCQQVLECHDSQSHWHERDSCFVLCVHHTINASSLCPPGMLCCAVLCRFGHVVSCAMDVFCYLEALGSSSRQQLSGALADRAQQATQQFKQLQEQAGSQQPGDNSSSNDKALLKLLRRQMSARQVGTRRECVCVHV